MYWLTVFLFGFVGVTCLILFVIKVFRSILVNKMYDVS